MPRGILTLFLKNDTMIRIIDAIWWMRRRSMATPTAVLSLYNLVPNRPGLEFLRIETKAKGEDALVFVRVSHRGTELCQLSLPLDLKEKRFIGLDEQTARRVNETQREILQAVAVEIADVLAKRRFDDAYKHDRIIGLVRLRASLEKKIAEVNRELDRLLALVRA